MIIFRATVAWFQGAGVAYIAPFGMCAVQDGVTCSSAGRYKRGPRLGSAAFA